MTLEEFFRQNPRAALAFSGGADSAYLLWAGLRAGAEVRPYFVKTPFQPRFELEDAWRLCNQLDAELTVLDCDILSDEASMITGSIGLLPTASGGCSPT